MTRAEAGPTIHLAGQCPLDRHGDLVGPGDVLAQVDQVVSNAMTALSAAGTVPGEVVRSVIYVAATQQKVLARVWSRFTGSSLEPAFTTASTLLGVTCLGYPGQLVELDLTAAPEAG